MSTTTRLFLVRHGAVPSSWLDRLYGRLDVPLSPAGEEEARRGAAALAGESLAAVVSSGLPRAEFTAAMLRGPRGLERLDDERLLEFDRGSWAGRTREDLARTEPELWARSLAAGGAINAPGAETAAEVCARVGLGLDAAAALAPGQQVAVVAHLWVLRAAAVLVLGLEPAHLARIHVPTGGLLVLDWVRGETCAGARSQLIGLGADQLPPARR